MVARKSPADAKAIHVLSSGIKAAATWTRVETLQDCRECCGGMGFLAVNKIGLLCNDQNVDVTFEGDNTVMMQQVARACLEDKALLAAGKSAASAAGGGTALTASIAKQPPGPLAHGVLTALLRGREASLAAQLASAIATSGGNGAAFDANLDTAVALGWANVERFCMENFAREVEAAGTPGGLRPALRLLASLYGMSRLERDAAFFLATGAMGERDM
jgi:acyl-CoA oxidase